MDECGNVKIYFGKVRSIDDKDKELKSRITINGKTNEIAVDDLPWYFKLSGLNYLPVENDIVPVYIFDDNFATGFYGKKIDNKLNDISDDDYPTYLEIYKRDNVELIYSKSKGIKFSLGDNTINITEEVITQMVSGFGIEIEKSKISIGDSTQANLLGDDTVGHLHKIIAHQANTITLLSACFKAIVSSAGGNPFTSPIAIALAPLIATAEASLKPENSMLDAKTDMLQSKKIFIA